MTNTNTINNFSAYILTVKYNKDYFKKSNEPLTKKLKYVSSDDRTLQQIQRNYPNCKVLNSEKIQTSKNTTILDFMKNYKIS
jgi:hypothetical protein